jgi:hypothetical protein
MFWEERSSGRYQRRWRGKRQPGRHDTTQQTTSRWAGVGLAGKYGLAYDNLLSDADANRMQRTRRSIGGRIHPRALKGPHDGHHERVPERLASPLCWATV